MRDFRERRIGNQAAAVRMCTCDFSKMQPPYDLTYSDVSWCRDAQQSPRLDVDLRSTDGIGTTLPLAVPPI